MPIKVMQQNEPLTQTATIALNGTLAPTTRLPNAHELAAIIMPAAWTAADITFQVGPTAAALANLHDSTGAEVTLTVTVSHYVPLPKNIANSARFLRLRSGTSGTPVTQLAAREIILVTRPIA